MSASSKKKLRKEQNAAALTEKQQKERTEAKKLKKQTIAFVAVIALVLAIGIGSLTVTAYNNSGIAERNTTALTIGEHKLSAAELSYFYFDAINAFYSNWYNSYGESAAAYLSMFYGLDITKPLDEQMYDEEKNLTFAEYFVNLAVENAVNAYTMYDLATAKGQVLDELGKANVEYSLLNLELSSKNAGYSKPTQYLKAVYGNGATVESFQSYLELMALSDTFQNTTYDGLTYSDSDINTYNEEHFNEFSSFTYDTFYVSTSDLLVCTADEDDKDHEHSQEELDAALLAAQNVVSSIKEAKPATTEELNKVIRGLDAYAEKESVACTEAKDKLYSAISDAEIVEWLADSSRKAGDLTVVNHTNETTDESGNKVTNTYGFTVVLFHERNDNETKLVNVRHILKAFKNGTTDELGNTVYSLESMKEAEKAINTLKDTWVSGEKTEESFKALVADNSDDSGSVSNGGLYENVYPGQMVTAFNDWCFDEARQSGDYGIVETEYGYHLVYFVGSSDVTYRDYMIEKAMRNSDFDKWYQEQVDAAKYTVNDTSKLNTGFIIAGY
mgnify:CR=1 FL=1